MKISKLTQFENENWIWLEEINWTKRYAYNYIDSIKLIKILEESNLHLLWFDILEKKNNNYDYKVPCFSDSSKNNYSKAIDFINKYYKWDQYIFDFVFRKYIEKNISN